VPQWHRDALSAGVALVNTSHGVAIASPGHSCSSLSFCLSEQGRRYRYSARPSTRCNGTDSPTALDHPANPLVGESPTSRGYPPQRQPSFHLPSEQTHPGIVAHLASAVPEVELGQVSRQVLDRDVVVRSVDRPLELAEIVLGLVRARSGDPVHVLVLGVIDGRVRDELLPELAVPGTFVGPQFAASHVDLLGDDLPQIRTRHLGNHSRANFASVGIDERQYGDLRGSAAGRVDPRGHVELVPVGAGVLVHPLGVATDPRLVSHDGAAHGRKKAVATRHRVADSVCEVPGRPRSQSVLALYLSGAHSVLGSAHLEDDEQPRPNRHLCCVHHRVREDRKLLAAAVATPHPALAHRSARCPTAGAVGRHDQGDVGAVAVGTDRGLAPTEGLKVLVRLGFGGDLLAQGGDVRLGHSPIFAGGCNSQTPGHDTKGGQ